LEEPIALFAVTETDEIALNMVRPLGATPWKVNGTAIVNWLPYASEALLSNHIVEIELASIVNWDVGMENPAEIANCTTRDVRDRVVVKPVT
jgi:hypothetical protein